MPEKVDNKTARELLGMSKSKKEAFVIPNMLIHCPKKCRTMKGCNCRQQRRFKTPRTEY